MAYDDEAEVWKPVQTEDYRKLFDGLAKSSCELRLAGREAEAVFTVREAGETGVKAEMRAQEAIPFRPQEALTAKFNYANETYFFRCSPVFSGLHAQLEPADGIFQLQRRKTYRIPIPEGFPSRIELHVRRHGTLPLAGTIVNINTFGIAFEVEGAEKFQSGEIIEAEVQLGSRKSVKVGGHVRHTREMGGKTQIGVQFDHTMHASQDAVQSILNFFRHDSFYFKNKK